MAQHEATPSSIDDEIKKLASPFRPTASTIAMCFYSLACIDFFATAVGAPSWGATIVALLHNAGGISLPAEITFVAVGVLFLVIAYLANHLSRWAQTLKGDLRATIPSGEWANGQHFRPIVAWLVMLPIMTGIAFKLISVVDAYAIFGVLFSSTILIALAIITSWITAAMAVGMSRDRSAIWGLSVTLLAYFFAIAPFGATLFSIAPYLNTPGFYSPLVPNVTWAYAVIFYIVLIARTLLIFENEGDYEQVRLLIGDGINQKSILDIHRYDLIFEKPVYLLIVPQNAQIITFVREVAGDLFTYIPQSKLSDTQIRVDKQHVCIINLTAIAAQSSDKFEPIKGMIEISGKFTFNVMESKFGKNIGRKFTLLQLQMLREIFDVGNFNRVLRSNLEKTVQSLTDEIFRPLIGIEQFVSLVRADVDIATIRGESQARDRARLLNANYAAAVAGGHSTSTALNQATVEAIEQFKKIGEMQSSVNALPANIAVKWAEGVEYDLIKLCDSKDGKKPDEITDFNRSLGVNISIDSPPIPAALIDIKAKLEKVIEFSEKAKEIQERSDSAAKGQISDAFGIAAAPNLRKERAEQLMDYLTSPTTTTEQTIELKRTESEIGDSPEPM